MTFFPFIGTRSQNLANITGKVRAPWTDPKAADAIQHTTITQPDQLLSAAQNVPAANGSKAFPLTGVQAARYLLDLPEDENMVQIALSDGESARIYILTKMGMTDNMRTI